MSANVIIFEGQYIADQMRNIDKARNLIGEAIGIIRKASQHRNWKCNETHEIDNGIDIISNRLNRLNTGITRTGIALGKGLVSFTELEQRSESQANTLSSNLKNNYGFEAADRSTGTNSIMVATMIIPPIQGGKITVSVLQTWFAEIQKRLREFWENFAKKRTNSNSGYQPPVSSGTPTSTPAPDVNSNQDNTQHDETPANVETPETSSGGLSQGNFDSAVDIVFFNEGGYSNDPNDPGGATNMGITHSTLNNAYQQGIVSHNDVTKLTVNEAKAIYKKMYWEASNADKLPDPLATLYFDSVVLCGQYGGGKLLQRAMNSLGQSVVVDGYVGPQTIAALNEQLKAPEDVAALCNALCDARQAYHNADVNAKRVNRMRDYTNNWSYA